MEIQLVIIAGLVVIAIVAYILWRRRARPAPPAESLPPSPSPEVKAPESAPPPALPTVQPPQFFELVTAEKKLLRFAITQSSTTIGRAPDNDIVVNEQFPGYESVADHHARVEMRGDLVIIQDLKSPTGLFVNDRRTGKNVLRNGWRIGLGDVEMVFRTAGMGTAPLNLPEPAAPGQEAGRPARSASPFAALPEGALIADRYIVIETRHESPHLNLYIVENLNPVRRCAQCGFEENPIERNTCVNCNAALEGAMLYYPHHQVKETDNADSLAIEYKLTGLVHPAAMLPREALQETPYGDVLRYYLIGPDAPRQLAATARIPQKVTDVLLWGEQLGEGLKYLHQNGIALGPIDAWRVALDGPQARWVDFAQCEFVTQDQQASFAADVVGLASILYYLLTGQRDYSAELAESLPPAVDTLFNQALNLKVFPTAAKFVEALQAASVEVRRPSSVELRIGRASDVGRVRQLNEDSVLTLEMTRIRRSISEPIGLYVVADGMGGHAAGDVASALAIDTLARKAIAELWMDYLLESDETLDAGAWLKLAVQEANQVVFGRRRASTSDMGTTLVAALVCCNKNAATIVHAGDSRAYLINQAGIRQLTTDHSLVQRLIQLGQLTPQEARTHPQRNVIYKNLGDKPRIEPDITEVKLEAGDRLLLCSDGLSGMVTDEKIHQIVMSASSPQEACRQLVDAANAAGGDDNISVIVIQLEALG